MNENAIEVDKSAKEFKYLMNRLARDGHTIERRGSSHYMVKHKNGQGMVTLPGTSGDRKALQNATSRLRRQGFDV